MAFAHYSNLFTSGLLSDSPISSPSSQASSPWSLEDDYVYRRGSLPGTMDSLDSASSSNSLYGVSTPSSRAMPESLPSGDSLNFSSPPAKRRRNPAYFRSFLSLDLAESQSVRASLKRKDSSFSIGMAMSPALRSSFSSFSHMSLRDLPRLHIPSSSDPATSSRESVRSIPSPKPVPMSALPTVPNAERRSMKSSASSTRSSSRRSSNFVTPRDSSLSPIQFAPPSPMSPRPTRSSAYVSSPLSRTAHVTSPSVNSGFRRVQRGKALANLEGRRNSTHGKLKFMQDLVDQRNFMYMSDDEDDAGARADIESILEDEKDEAVDPMWSRRHSVHSVQSTHSRRSHPSNRSSRRSKRKENAFSMVTSSHMSPWEQLIYGSLSMKTYAPSFTGTKIDSVDSLALDVDNFIDLHDDKEAYDNYSDSLSWSSFVEVPLPA